MLQQSIYQVQIMYVGQMAKLIDKEPTITYFSNLKKCFNNICNALAINGWDHNINYTAMYRSLIEKGNYQKEFNLKGQKMFKIIVYKTIINPNISLLGIEPNPTLTKIV